MPYDGCWCDNCKKIVSYKIEDGKLICQERGCGKVLRRSGRRWKKGSEALTKKPVKGCFSLGRITETIHYYRKLCQGQKINKTNLKREHPSVSMGDDDRERGRKQAKQQAITMLKEHGTKLYGNYSSVSWYPREKNKISDEEAEELLNDLT